MILEPSLFFRKYGIRNSNQLVKPPLPKLELLNLPKNSIFHYPGTSALDDGPVDTDPIFGQTQRPIYIDHISRISSTEGNPRVLVYDVNKQIRLHRTNNPRFRLFKDAETSYRDPFIHVCFSYSLIHRTYKYLRNYYTAYYQWYNLTSTIWNKIDEVTTYVPTINRNHYIEVDLPNILPSISSLNLAEKVMNQNTVKVFNSPESLMILDIWKWLGKNRSKSIIGLNLRSKEQYDKINIIFKESGRWFVINLGVLDSWRKSQPGEKPDGQEITKGLDPEQLQKRFLRLLISLFEARTNPDLPDNVDVKEDVVLDQSLDQTETKTTTVDNDGSLDPDDDDVDETTDVRNEREVIQIASDFEDENHEQIDAEIEADLEKLETTGDNSGMDVVVDGNVSTQVIEIKTKPNTLEGAIVEHCDRLADSGGLSAAEYRKYLEMASTYKTLKAPDGTTLDKFIQIAPQDLQIKESPSIPDKNTIVDKTMLKSSLLEFDKKYVNHILQKDIAAAVLSIQKAGVIVTDYEVEEVEDITGSHFVYQVKIKPLQGTASTIHFKIPKVDDEGNFMVNGVNYRLRKQRGDLPIRKISPSRVSLTSYYGKVFVERNDRRTNNYGKWLAASIMVLGFNKESDLITNMAPGNSFRNEIKLPRLYTILAQNFNSFTLKTKRNEYDLYWNLNFDYNSRAKITSSNNIGEIEQDGAVVAGSNSQGQILVIGKNNALYHTVSSTDFSLQAMPSIEDLLGISSKKTPLDFAELRVFGKSIPVGVILSYLYGFSKLVRSLKITPRVVPAGQRTQLTPDEWEIVFQDETWVFNREDRLASMILGGWREHRDTTITYNVHEFDKPDVYLNVLEDAGLGVRYLREIDLLSNMFVDPITKDLLVEMKEPTDFEGLLKRSSELLLLDHHPNELDSEYMRIKGYERFAGVVYSEMVRSIRIHNARPGKYRYPVEMNPYAVWIQINQDPAKNQVVEINPIQNMKEAEAVTYSGIGGRSSRSMVKRTRVYHKNDMGTISESTVDNSDVGINIFLSGDPQFTSLRGISRRYVVGKSGATPLLSSSALLSVGATVDDPKRVNFIAIQHGHGVSCNGYHQNSVRTGYEQVIPYKTGEMFAYMAKKSGKVISANDQGIIVEYEDGERKGVQLGSIYGKAAGLIIPHTVITPLRTGDVFKEGDPIAYNDGFFEPDVLNPKQIVWKSAVNARTVLLESADTLEDSSAISTRLASKLRTKITKVRTIVVGFQQQVHRLVKVGQVLESESILCNIDDNIGGRNTALDDSILDTLRVLSSQSPLSKIQGKVERIEVYYHGDKEDMSESLREIADISDTQISKRNRSAGRKAFTGSIDENFRIDNEALALDTAAIQIYITAEVDAGVGDKGVFGNQMKTVFGRVFGENTVTESGKPIDAIFGAKSIDDRIVLSPIVIGTTTTLLDVIGKKAVEMYKK